MTVGNKCPFIYEGIGSQVWHQQNVEVVADC